MVATSLDLVLASASPARRRLLLQARIPHRVEVSGFDEAGVSIGEPKGLVTALAQGKAVAVQRRLGLVGPLVLGCDSVLVLDAEIHGKPKDAAEALERWQRMRGSHGELHTGHCLVDTVSGRHWNTDVVTRVHFADVDNATLAAYVASGEPLHCAGAFALEGRGGLLVRRLEGCHSNVIGLSLPWLGRTLLQAGVDPEQLWGP